MRSWVIFFQNKANYKTKTTDKQKIMPPTNQPTHADVVYSLLREINENTNATRMCIRAFMRYALSKNLKGRLFNRITFLKRKQLLFTINIFRNNGVIRVVNERILFDFLILNEYTSSQFITRQLLKRKRKPLLKIILLLLRKVLMKKLV
jgi:hypothetical protein